MNKYEQAAKLISNSRKTIAFTGAGVSVESGVPPFRGEGGLWNKYAPSSLDIDFFLRNPKKSWKVIKEIFFDFFGKVKPNPAHTALAKMEEKGLLKAIVTQNIDNLHQEAGSKVVYEFHGNSQKLICLDCGKIYSVPDFNLEELPPRCEKCAGLLKPDFIFFGEGIPLDASEKSVKAAKSCDVCLVIGSTGEVVPAAHIPWLAKSFGASIIEINPNESAFTRPITDIFIKEKAGAAMTKLIEELKI